MWFVVSTHSVICAVWKVFCFCAHYTFLMYRLECVLFLCTVEPLMYRMESVLFLCTVHISDVRLESVQFLCTVNIYDLPSGKCFVSVLNTHFCFTAWKRFCFCAKYKIMIYHLERFLFQCTVHISDVPSRKCSVSVHSTHF